MGRVERLWVIGGVVAAALLLAGAWFLLISPQRGEVSQLAESRADAQVRVGTLQKRLADLKAQNENLPRYQAELGRNRRALPTDPQSADLLRQINEAGDKAGVTVDALVVGLGNAAAVKGTAIQPLNLSLTVVGSPGAVELFLDQLQQVQPRAVLITSGNVSDAATKGSDDVQLSLSLQAFFAPPATAAPGGAGTGPGAQPTPGTS
jgi:Tfp pilus assembly protein PilO